MTLMDRVKVCPKCGDVFCRDHLREYQRIMYAEESKRRAAEEAIRLRKERGTWKSILRRFRQGNNPQHQPPGEDRQMIADDKLDEWQKLCEKATPGPWEAKLDPVKAEWMGVQASDTIVALVRGYNDAGKNMDDAEFIATAREALSALIEEVKRLRNLQEPPLQTQTGPEA